MGLAVFGEESVGVGDAKVLEVEEGVRMVFANQLYESIP